MTDRHAQLLDKRIAWVRQYREKNLSPEAFVDCYGPGPDGEKAGTLRNWDRRLEDGLPLSDGRWTREVCPRVLTGHVRLILWAIWAIWFSDLRNAALAPSMCKVQRWMGAALKKHGWTDSVPSETTLRSALHKLNVSPPDREALESNPEYRELMKYFDAHPTCRGSMFETDSQQLAPKELKILGIDLVYDEDGKVIAPWVMRGIYVAPRVLAASLALRANPTAVDAAVFIRHAASQHVPPEIVRTDGGSEYRPAWIGEGIEIGLGARHQVVYCPLLRPHIERVHQSHTKTMADLIRRGAVRVDQVVVSLGQVRPAGPREASVLRGLTFAECKQLVAFADDHHNARLHRGLHGYAPDRVWAITAGWSEERLLPKHVIETSFAEKHEVVIRDGRFVFRGQTIADPVLEGRTRVVVLDYHQTRPNLLDVITRGNDHLLTWSLILRRRTDQR
jgi:hypothetical protein